MKSLRDVLGKTSRTHTRRKSLSLDQLEPRILLSGAIDSYEPDDTEGLVISDAVVEEYDGDGDSMIGGDEHVCISWNLADASAVGSTELLV